jgi:hypothetical protein
LSILEEAVILSQKWPEKEHLELKKILQENQEKETSEIVKLKKILEENQDKKETGTESLSPVRDRRSLDGDGNGGRSL